MDLLHLFYLLTILFFVVALFFSDLLIRRGRAVDRADSLTELKEALRIWGKPIDDDRLMVLRRKLRDYEETMKQWREKTRTVRIVASGVSIYLFISTLVDEWSDHPGNRETILVFFFLMTLSILIARLLFFVITRHL